MMWPLAIGALIGAGVGAAKGRGDQQRAAQQRKQEAEIARWAPWSGMQAQRVQDPSMMGSVVEGGLTGASFGQGFSGGSKPAASVASSPAPSAAPSTALVEPIGTDTMQANNSMPQVQYGPDGQPLPFDQYWQQKTMQQNPYGKSAWSAMRG